MSVEVGDKVRVSEDWAAGRPCPVGVVTREVRPGWVAVKFDEAIMDEMFMTRELESAD